MNYYVKIYKNNILLLIYLVSLFELLDYSCITNNKYYHLGNPLLFPARKYTIDYRDALISDDFK